MDVERDARPRILAHATIAIVRAGISAWLQGGGQGDPVGAVAATFDRPIPALEAVLAMPPG